MVFSWCAAADQQASSPTPGPGTQSSGYAKIRFSVSEVPLGTHVTYHYADLGIYFGGDNPFTTNDSANMANSPVLSGTPIFQGAIEGRFIVPQTPDPNICDPNLIAVVSWFSLDAGYFDTEGTTRLEWFDPHDVKLGEVYNSKTGIEHFHVEGLNIARWRISTPASDPAGFAIDNIDFELAPLVEFNKEDDVASGDCRGFDEAITYTICFQNASSQTIYDAYIIDYLPEGVRYGRAYWTLYPNDIFNPIPPDPGYDGQTHTYVWPLGDLEPEDNGCRALPVYVNEQAIPGGVLQNVAELWGTVYDANGLNPELTLIARATEETPVCCETDTVIYVDASAAAGGDGRSWPTAYRDVQDALARARAAMCGQVYEIWVAQGTYSPGSDESDTFDLRENIVALYGGFPPGGCPFEQRNPTRYKPTLSGVIDPNTRTDTVVVMGNNTVLDGFTITGASQDGYGIYGSQADFVIHNCNVIANENYGIYSEDCNVEMKWCNIRNNKADGVYHQGEGFELTVENCWIRESRQYGIRCINSTPSVRNSVISESDLANEGRAGIHMVNSTNTPILYNLTVAHNKSTGVARVAGTLPNMQNCIVYYNNDGGPQLAGFKADDAAWFSCIQDCNSVNFNISAEPQLAYLDPNNVRIAYESPCKDAGSPLLTYDDQIDMDGRVRVLGNYVDIGAYEIDCEDVSNALDWNADGLVNLHEFNYFSRAWLSHDPNDPAWLANPNLADPSLSEGWYEWKYRCNLDATGGSAYQIDLADLLFLLEESPWLWVACWRTDIWQPEMMMSAGGDMLRMSEVEPMYLETPAVQEKTTQEQILDVVLAIVQLEQIWLEEPDIQQTISPDDWQRFMEAVYQNLLEFQIEAVQ
jgi:hypothetical protein